MKYYSKDGESKGGIMCSKCVTGHGLTKSGDPIEEHQVEDLSEKSRNPHARHVHEQNEKALQNDHEQQQHGKTSWYHFKASAPSNLTKKLGKFAKSNYISANDGWSERKLNEMVYLIGYLSLHEDHKTHMNQMLLTNIYSLIHKFLEHANYEDKDGASRHHDFDIEDLQSFKALKERILSNPGILLYWEYEK